MNMTEPDFEQTFPVGAKVRCENEMWPGHWDYGVVEKHDRSRYNDRMGIIIRIESENENKNGMLVEYDYRYLDKDPHNSLVRLVKKDALACLEKGEEVQFDYS